ncbi:MAG: putative quinol monooxygenase [Planctomycetota bacterium]|jgi:quinol monooxygenase YgiN
MIVLNIKMHVYPEKRKELMQTVNSLIEDMKNMQQCHTCDLYQNANDENTLILTGEWEKQEDLDTYFRSEPYRVLLGAMSSLSQKPPETKIETIDHTTGMEVVKATRGRKS